MLMIFYINKIIFSHLSPGVHTTEAMRNYKSLESWKLVDAGWVRTILHMKSPSTGNIILKADVTPSFRINNPPHHPWVAAAPDGTIITAHCDCKAG